MNLFTKKQFNNRKWKQLDKAESYQHGFHDAIKVIKDKFAASAPAGEMTAEDVKQFLLREKYCKDESDFERDYEGLIIHPADLVDDLVKFASQKKGQESKE